jgi:hypothetical protein
MIQPYAVNRFLPIHVWHGTMNDGQIVVHYLLQLREEMRFGDHLRSSIGRLESELMQLNDQLLSDGRPNQPA